ncbi:MAG: hypothetical protein HKM98_08990 [Gammaproteobacteria bacterium]|nr:hypothetical protein [Gammaproteobacteria bacterium]
MTGRILIATLVFGLATSAASADDDFWLGVKAGTLGLGLEASWRPVPYLDLRAGVNGYSFDKDGNEAGIDYLGDADLMTVFATANFRVPLSPFRVTAGLFNNGNELTLTSRDSSTYQVGSQTYTSDEVGTLRAGATFEDWAPYAGLGFDFRVLDTVGLHIDAGVLGQGSPNVTLTADGSAAGDPQFQQELEAERMELQRSVDDYEYYPVVSIGFSFNF